MTPTREAVTQPDFSTADACYEDLKRRVRPGFFGKLSLCLSVENGQIRLTNVEESRNYKSPPTHQDCY